MFQSVNNTKIYIWLLFILVGFVSAARLWSNSKYGAGSARPDRPNQDRVWPERSGTVPGYRAPCATSQASGKKRRGQKVLVNKALVQGEESLWHISDDKLYFIIGTGYTAVMWFLEDEFVP